MVLPEDLQPRSLASFLSISLGNQHTDPVQNWKHWKRFEKCRGRSRIKTNIYITRKNDPGKTGNLVTLCLPTAMLKQFASETKQSPLNKSLRKSKARPTAKSTSWTIRVIRFSAVTRAEGFLLSIAPLPFLLSPVNPIMESRDSVGCCEWGLEMDSSGYQQRGEYQDVCGLGPHLHPDINLNQRQFYKPRICEKQKTKKNTTTKKPQTLQSYFMGAKKISLSFSRSCVLGQDLLFQGQHAWGWSLSKKWKHRNYQQVH